MKTIVNKNPEHDPYFNGTEIVISNSTSENLLVAECVPDRKRRAILQSALDQADVDNDVVFVTAFEALMGYYIIED